MVCIGRVGKRVQVCVQDDGIGFDPDQGRTLRGGFGLLSIQEGLEQLGGRLVIQSAKGRGTKVTLAAPLGAPARDR